MSGKSLYNIIENFKYNAEEKPLYKPTIQTFRTTMPGAPGRISFRIQEKKPLESNKPLDHKKPLEPNNLYGHKKQFDHNKPLAHKKYNPADWPEEEDLPIPASKPSHSLINIPRIHKKK